MSAVTVRLPGEPKRVASALIYQDGRQILSLNRFRQWHEARP